MTKPVKIVLAGPPRSGKSCLRYGLREALIALAPACPYPWFITACPDGEGSWFHSLAATDPGRANSLKAKYRSDFTQEHASAYAAMVHRSNLPLTLVDVGGRITLENRNICQHATHAILIAGNLGELDSWRSFFKELGVSIMAELWSDYHGTEDAGGNLDEHGVFRGSIHRLQRGDIMLPGRPTIQSLASAISSMNFPAQESASATTLDVSMLFSPEPSATLELLPQYEMKARSLLPLGSDATLTGRAPIWLYLRIVEALRNHCHSISYHPPDLNSVEIFRQGSP